VRRTCNCYKGSEKTYRNIETLRIGVKKASVQACNSL
jgi:hypothetical protein